MKQKLLLFILLFFISGTIFSQMAPDFTVVDSDGNTHRLYADYLNKGKTVMLKLFFVNCPPCNQIAPHLETLYQEWGAGEGDVEFFEVSILSSDTDVKVNGYKMQHGLTFPSVGGEGGSVTVTTPYQQGQFGNYTGTPTFIVIAPSGLVDFDVFGLGTQGQLNALSASFEATGAMRPITSSTDVLNDFKNNVKISPNPFYDDAKIVVSTKKAGQLKYQLYDLLGNQVQSEELGFVARGEHLFNYNFRDLRAGTYIIRISLDEMPIKSIKAIKR